jgi:hypothetical protein
VNTLVDSGCTGIGCIDRATVESLNLRRYRLPRPQPLYLANGQLDSFLTHFVTIRLGIGPHVEDIALIETTLGRQNPIILGYPWLAHHNPHIDWPSRSIQFGSRKCRDNCLPQGIAFADCTVTSVPLSTLATPTTRSQPRLIEMVASPPPAGYQKPSLEDVTDEDEGYFSNPDAPELPIQLEARSSMTYSPVGQGGQARECPAWRPHSSFPRRMGENSALRPRHTEPARSVAGVRRPHPQIKPPATPVIPTATHLPIDDTDLRLLSAPNFLMLSRQDGVSVFRTTWGELEETTRTRDPVQLPNLHEGVFQDILSGRGDLNIYKAMLPEAFHDFLEVCMDPTPAQRHALRRISEEDAETFFAKSDKPPATEAEIRAKVPECYHDLLQAFLPAGADILPPRRSYDHKIELLPGSALPYSKARPMSYLELKVVKRWLDDSLQKGWVRPSNSSAAAPVLLARKPGGGVRICVDYRGLNNITLKNRYPIPLIRETLDLISQAKVFTKLDVIAAFNRIRIAEGHEFLTAFITRFGLYESLVMPFGLCGAPATWQHFLNDQLYDILDVYATAYLDDILIFSKNRKDHIAHVREVLKRLVKCGLNADIKKCEFFTTRTKYLGIIITPGGIEMDPEKVRAVTAWDAPKTRRQLQRFLGFANFYRRFIKAYSTLAAPLVHLTKKDTQFTWTTECQAAFDALKHAFVAAPALQTYDWRLKSVVEVDASNWATGGCLSQIGADGELHPVAYFSAKHSPAECNYDIYDKELLAIIKALEEWRPELEGSAEPFQIVTDHKNLQTFSTTKQLSPRHMRWSEFLSRFNFKIVYKPGTLNTRPDALSRKPEDVPRSENDDRLKARRRPLIDPAKFDATILASMLDSSGYPVALFTLDTTRHIDDLIDESYTKSDLLAAMISALREGRRWPPELKPQLRIPFAECELIAGRIYFRKRLFIDPEDSELQLQIIYRTHASGPGGHPGRTKTIDLLNRKYYWPNMTTAIRGFTDGCLMCDKSKTPRAKPSGFLKPLPLPFRAWEDISIDFISPLPACIRHERTFKHILVVVDRLTKMRHFIATETLDTEELVDRFVDRVYSLHGVPETIVSDRGSAFVSAFWRALSTRLGITLKPSSAWHPATNGQTERVNAELESYLRMFVNWAQTDWATWLPLAEFAGNNMVSETTGVSPFYANYGFNPRMGVEPARPLPPDMSEHQRHEFFNAQELADRFAAVLDKLKALSRQAQDRYEANANAKREDAPIYKVGDWVMLDVTNIETGRPMDKLAPRWEGPFEVIKTSSHAVTLRLPANMRVFPTFHVSLVRRRRGHGIPGQDTNQDVRANKGRVMIRTDGTDDQPVVEWKFTKILDYGKADNGRWQYLVQWEPPHEPTWQPVGDLRGCDDAIWAFHDTHPELPGPPTWVKKRTAPSTRRSVRNR